MNVLRWAWSNYSSRHTKVHLLCPFAIKKLKSLALPVQLEGPEVIQTDLAMCRLQPHNGGETLLPRERFFYLVVAGDKMPQSEIWHRIFSYSIRLSVGSNNIISLTLFYQALIFLPDDVSTHSCCAAVPHWALHTHPGFIEHIQEDFTCVPRTHRTVWAKVADSQKSWTKVLQLLGHFGFTGCTRKHRSAHVIVAFQWCVHIDCAFRDYCCITQHYSSNSLPDTHKSWKKQPRFWFLAWTKFQYGKRRLDRCEKRGSLSW